MILERRPLIALSQRTSNPSIQPQTTEELLACYARSGDESLRKTIIERHEPLVSSLARKFARPTVLAEDLVQVGWVALIRAVDRFDPRHHTKFSSYAYTCISGEIKRHFRDKTWGVKGPRRLQCIATSLHRMRERLRLLLRREPTLDDLAGAFAVGREDLVAAMELYRGYRPVSLSLTHETAEGGETVTLAERIGAPDPETQALVRNAPLHAALTHLDARGRQILRWRFWEGWSQQKVADTLGISQMHVSRLERKTLAQLRDLVQI